MFDFLKTKPKDKDMPEVKPVAGVPVKPVAQASLNAVQMKAVTGLLNNLNVNNLALAVDGNKLSVSVEVDPAVAQFLAGIVPLVNLLGKLV